MMDENHRDSLQEVVRRRVILWTRRFHTLETLMLSLFVFALGSFSWNVRQLSDVEDNVHVMLDRVLHDDHTWSSRHVNASRTVSHDNDNDNNNTNTNNKIVEFQRQDGAVIVTKIHGPHQIPLLQQSLCLLHQAYNHRVLYDILVFTTLPMDDRGNDALSLVRELQAVVAPARLDVVVDNEGIVNEVRKLSPARRDAFLRRCNASRAEDVTWDTVCEEEGVKTTRISYNWQAEFRSWHIWRHPALAKYRYMMWIDSDAFCSRPWERDPMAVAIQHDLAILFANYPQGRAKVAQPRVQKAFGKFLCSARKNNGHLQTVANNECGSAQLWTVHGFWHVTSLDFYRQEQVIRWAETLIGDCFLCRRFDDQVAVTVPAAILAPERSWDMYRNGIELDVAHNNLLDGKRKKKVGGFLNYWKNNAKEKFPEAWDKCTITEGS